MLTTTKRLRAAEAEAARLRIEAAERDAKFRNFVSHATGGRTDDTTLSAAELAAKVNAVVNDAYGAGGFNPLPSMSDAERKVLDEMRHEWGVRLTELAANTGLKESDVRAIVKVFVLRGFAEFGWLGSEDDIFLRGRGYVLNDSGYALQKRLAAMAPALPTVPHPHAGRMAA